MEGQLTIDEAFGDGALTDHEAALIACRGKRPEGTRRRCSDLRYARLIVPFGEKVDRETSVLVMTCVISDLGRECLHRIANGERKIQYGFLPPPLHRVDDQPGSVRGAGMPEQPNIVSYGHAKHLLLLAYAGAG